MAKDSSGQGSHDSGDISIPNLIGMLRRRRTSFLITAVLITALQAARTLHEREVHPVSTGGFSLLVSAPVHEDTETIGAEEAGALASLARNSSSVDLPTLMAVLQARSVLGPVAEDLKTQGVPAQDLPSITVGMANAESRGAGRSYGVVERRSRNWIRSCFGRTCCDT